MSLYHQNRLVTDIDLAEISSTYRVPFEVVQEVLAQIEVNGTPHYHVYDQEMNGKIRKLADNISTFADCEPEALTENEDMLDRAANGLMSAMADPLHGTFILNDGICTINPKNPPQLIHSYQVVANVLKLRDLGGKIDDKSSWMLGSIINELKNYHGEAFEISQVCDQTTKTYNTVYTAEEVYKAFKNKRYNVTFTHHKEAYFAKIADEDKKLVLHKSEVFELTSKHVRSLCGIIKSIQDSTLVANIRSREQALDLIKANQDLKVTYITYNDQQWKRINGTATSIPNGTLTIDLKNWTVRRDNGEPEEIEKK
jgi:hypothetical protein